MTTDHERLRAEFEALRPALEKVAAELSGYLRELCRELGIYAPRIESRVKETHSLILKVFRKERAGYPFAEPLRDMTDKVGARADLVYAQDVDRLIERLRSANDFFEPISDDDIDDKRYRMNPDQVGYVGVHVDVRPRARHGLDEHVAVCEIQIRTNAQAAWAMASHELVYKSVITRTNREKRRVNRLTVLLELFDEEVTNARDAMVGAADYPVAVVCAELQAARFRFVGSEYDVELTRDITAALLPNMDNVGADSIVERIRAFADKNEAPLRRVIRKQYPILMSQPEVILILLLLEEDRFELQRAWRVAAMPHSMLANIADAWGAPLPDPL